MGRLARMYRVKTGMLKTLSKCTNTTPNKNADNNAPNPSIIKSCLGFDTIFFVMRSRDILDDK